MDKKIKKRIQVLPDRLQRLKQMLAGAKQQCDDLREITEIEQQIAKAQEELDALMALSNDLQHFSSDGLRGDNSRQRPQSLEARRRA